MLPGRRYPLAAVYVLIFLGAYAFMIIDSYVTPASFAGIWLVPVTAPWSLIVVFFLPEWPRPFFDLFFFAAAGVNTLLIGALERLRARRDNR